MGSLKIIEENVHSEERRSIGYTVKINGVYVSLEELLIPIFSRLSRETLSRGRGVSRSWRTLKNPQERKTIRTPTLRRR